MGGALIFALGLTAVLVLGTYLLQGAILLLQLAIWATVWAARIAFCLVGSVVWGAWWLVDRPAARAALQRAEAAAPKP